jgi:hypothetical protein
MIFLYLNYIIYVLMKFNNTLYRIITGIISTVQRYKKINNTENFEEENNEITDLIILYPSDNKKNPMAIKNPIL